MLSKSDIKFIKSLQVKKYRKQEQCFIVEGAKSVLELLASDFEIERVIGTAGFTSSLRTSVPVVEVSEKELQNLGEFQTNNTALAIARMKPNALPAADAQGFTLVLDDIRDPGNLGTIIRTADWYGLKTIIASEETADFYNPKVISATMGSFTRVSVFYTSLVEHLSRTKANIYGALLAGEDVHKATFRPGSFIVIGNESRGINPELERLITDKITIPRYGQAESLNAAIATAVILDNLRR